MGEVAVKIKIMPSSIDVDINDLKEKIKKAIPEGTKLQGRRTYCIRSEGSHGDGESW